MDALAVEGPQPRDAPDALPAVLCATAGRRTVSVTGCAASSRGATGEVRLEGGGGLALRAVTTAGRSDGTTLQLDGALPAGVHQLALRAGRRERTAYVLSAPPTLRAGFHRGRRRLALFLPLYGVRSRRNLGVGDLTDLRDLVAWAGQFDDAFVGTLPLFASFLDAPFDPSPYAPVSRLFWNELFIDPAAEPEFADPRIQVLFRSPSFRGRVARVCANRLLDYRLAYSLKRALLTIMAAGAMKSSRRREQLARFRKRNPYLDDYARFRALVNRRGTALPRAIPPPRGRTIRPDDVDPEAVMLHLYCQMVFQDQIERAARRTSSRNPLYLDLPVGVHGGGFDAWRFCSHFLHGVSAGAPPDDLNARGQVWGFPPMHPWNGRRDGYAYLRSVLAKLFSVAGVVRIDHVMGLHRLYCVPPGFDGTQGAYLRYPADELYAAVMIEAARAGGVVVGENLGTVPRAVNREMDRRGFLGLHVQQFKWRPPGRSCIVRPDARQLACLNTHDTPTFAGFWNGDDIRARRKIHGISAAAARKEMLGRRALRKRLCAELGRGGARVRTARQACERLLELHAGSPAPIQLVNLEDLWGETGSQNVPGTTTEHPNWRRRAAQSLEQFTSDARIRRLLQGLAARRAGGAGRDRHRVRGRPQRWRRGV